MAGQLTIDTLKASSGVLATQNGMTGIPKAWVNFDGVTPATRNSFNISSYTKNGTGDYTFAFSTAMPNANYSVNISTQTNPANGPDAPSLFYNRTSNVQESPTTSSFRVSIMGVNGAPYDRSYVCVSVFSS